jgi:hypothetical protein
MSKDSSDEVVQQRPIEDEDLSGRFYEPLGSTPGEVLILDRSLLNYFV